VEEVPWSVAWSGEQSFWLQDSRDFPGMVELEQKQARGAGEPLFAAIHVTRQRRGLADLLCHVCGKPTARLDRYIFPAASGGLVTLRDGSQQYGLNVPPMHRACALRARRACPHLGKVDEPPLRCSSDEGRLIHRTDVVPGMEVIARTLPPGLEVVFSCYRLYGPDFTKKVLAARSQWEEASRDRRRRRQAKARPDAE
jgi:hypothetical protein